MSLLVWTFRALNMTSLRCLETSGEDCLVTRRHIPEDRKCTEKPLIRNFHQFERFSFPHLHVEAPILAAREPNILKRRCGTKPLAGPQSPDT